MSNCTVHSRNSCTALVAFANIIQIIRSKQLIVLYCAAYCRLTGKHGFQQFMFQVSQMIIVPPTIKHNHCFSFCPPLLVVFINHWHFVLAQYFLIFFSNRYPVNLEKYLKYRSGFRSNRWLANTAVEVLRCGVSGLQMKEQQKHSSREHLDDGKVM